MLRRRRGRVGQHAIGGHRHETYHADRIASHVRCDIDRFRADGERRGIEPPRDQRPISDEQQVAGRRIDDVGQRGKQANRLAVEAADVGGVLLGPSASRDVEKMTAIGQELRESQRVLLTRSIERGNLGQWTAAGGHLDRARSASKRRSHPGHSMCRQAQRAASRRGSARSRRRRLSVSTWLERRTRARGCRATRRDSWRRRFRVSRARVVSSSLRIQMREPSRPRLTHATIRPSGETAGGPCRPVRSVVPFPSGMSIGERNRTTRPAGASARNARSRDEGRGDHHRKRHDRRRRRSPRRPDCRALGRPARRRARCRVPRFAIHFSSRSRSRAVCQRSSGSLARQVRTTADRAPAASAAAAEIARRARLHDGADQARLALALERLACRSASRRAPRRTQRCRCARRPRALRVARAPCTGTCRGSSLAPVRLGGVVGSVAIDCDRRGAASSPGRSRAASAPDLRQHDVAGLQIAVHDAVRDAPCRARRRSAIAIVKRLRRSAAAPRRAGRRASRLRGSSMTRNVDAVVLADVVERADVRVIQLRDRPRLAIEPLPELRDRGPAPAAGP